MKKKALALAVASALIAPSAFAATDTSGMRYTSASEGFYGSLRARYQTAPVKDTGADIVSNSSRIGVRGTSDLGGGLTGFYQWELEVPINDSYSNGKGLRTRIGNVGLRGDFGEVSVGSFWTFDYGATFSATDQANWHSGYFVYGQPREARSEKAIQYTTPDFNGFQSALLFSFDDNSDRGQTIDPVSNVQGSADVTGRLVTGDVTSKDENDLDSWNLAGSYAVQGFTLGASYNVRPDALTKKTSSEVVAAANAANTAGDIAGAVADAKSWTIRGSYAQDNWNVNAWYGQDNTSDEGILGKVGTDTVPASDAGTGDDMVAERAARAATLAKAEDTTYLAFHAGVAVDKVNLYAIHEIRENASKQEDVYTTLGVQYNLGSQARTWLEYVSQDYDSAPNNEDYVNIGLRFDF